MDKKWCGVRELDAGKGTAAGRAAGRGTERLRLQLLHKSGHFDREKGARERRAREGGQGEQGENCFLEMMEPV